MYGYGHTRVHDDGALTPFAHPDVFFRVPSQPPLTLLQFYVGAGHGEGVGFDLDAFRRRCLLYDAALEKVLEQSLQELIEEKPIFSVYTI